VPAPRVEISALPEQAAFVGTDLIVVQNGATTKKMSLTSLVNLPNDTITYAKMQNVSATDKVLGRSTAGAGDVEEIACTAAGRALLAGANAAAQRTTLGLVVGTDVQAFSQDLTDLVATYVPPTFSEAASVGLLESTSAGSTQRTRLFGAPALAADVTVTLPAVTSTLATLDGTETLLNKSLVDAKVEQSINAQVGTAYVLVLTDVSKLITMTNASASTLTIPTNASVAWPIGRRCDVLQLGAGQVTVSGAGVTIRATPGAKCRAQYSMIHLEKIATDTWVVWGDNAA
jgi:hypothetical protein